MIMLHKSFTQFRSIMGAGDKTRKQLEITQRKELAIQLRLDGFTYREIYGIMSTMASQGKIIIPESYDERYVHRDVTSVVDEAKKNLVETGEMLRIMELRNLDRLQQSIMDKALSGDLDSLDRVLKIMKQREKYVPDLTQPKKVDVKTWQSEILDFIKQGRITIEDVRDVYPKFAEQLMARLPESADERQLLEGSDTLEGEYIDLGEVNEDVSREGSE